MDDFILFTQKRKLLFFLRVHVIQTNIAKEELARHSIYWGKNIREKLLKKSAFQRFTLYLSSLYIILYQLSLFNFILKKIHFIQ
jgi:hypothetical protein